MTDKNRRVLERALELTLCSIFGAVVAVLALGVYALADRVF